MTPALGGLGATADEPASDPADALSDADLRRLAIALLHRLAERVR